MRGGQLQLCPGGGGGHYPSDAFYDACDELGLLVWQDFMFACAVYNLTPEFAENIRAEVTDNVRRLRHHASLGLWCGNNEMEMFVDQGEWVLNKRQKADYIRMHEYLIPEVLLKGGPGHLLLAGQPLLRRRLDGPNDPAEGRALLERLARPAALCGVPQAPVPLPVRVRL